jgi:hypothetical protein
MEAQTSRRHENRETRCPVSARTTRRYRLSVTTDKNAPPINFLARRESSEFLYRAGLAGMQRKTDDYRDQSIELALKGLDADRKRGLTSAEAAKRLARFGPNEIEEREEPLWHQLFRRFWGPIPWLIEIAAVLSALVQKWDDFIIILVMLLVNAGLDFMQEHRAHDALKVYITRSEGWFWQRPWPAPLLFWATFGTEILGTLIAVYGLLITPSAGPTPSGPGPMPWCGSSSTTRSRCGPTGCCAGNGLYEETRCLARRRLRPTSHGSTKPRSSRNSIDVAWME